MHTHKTHSILFLCALPTSQYLLLSVDTQTHTQITQAVVPVDGANAGDAVVVTHSLGQEPVTDLPGKHGGILAFVIGDLVDHFGCSNLWFGSPDYPGADTARFIVPANQNMEGVCVGHVLLVTTEEG